MVHYWRGLTRAVLLLCLGVLTACSSVPRQIVPLRVQLVSLSLLEATVEHQRFAVTLGIDNPNAFDIPISGIEFSARLSGQGVLIGQSAGPTTLPAGGFETVEVDVTTEIVSSFASLLAVVEGPDAAIPYELNGVIQIASGFDRRFRFNNSGRVSPRLATGP